MTKAASRTKTASRKVKTKTATKAKTLVGAVKERKPPRELTPAGLLERLKRGGQTTEQLATHFFCKPKAITEALGNLHESGYLVCLFGDTWRLEAKPNFESMRELELRSDNDGCHVLGFTSDQHLGSKYERLDVLNDLYDLFEREGVKTVLNGGNWIDGEAPFNRRDIHVHGMEAQVQYLIDQYPQRQGITTYSVAGDDHEGWLAQREGIDIGRYAERCFKESGRSDWLDLGYMEANIKLVNKRTGKACYLLLMHPGGGSAYAVSYKPQKIIESIPGGSKPAIVLIGHYHKLSYNIFRNVHAVQTGCTKDQCPFLRKLSIEPHIGGGVLRVWQDGDGAVIRVQTEFATYFDRGYYNYRWSKSGKVTQPSKIRA